MLAEVIPQLGIDVQKFVQATAQSCPSVAREKHARGLHYFGILGVDRNNKKVG